MLKIYIPNNNIAERKYVLDTVFGEFLGTDYKLIIDNGELIIDNWVIELENGNKLIIEDHFFNKFPKDLEYLKEENIPKNVEFAKNRFAPEEDIPIIYGTNKPETKNQKPKTITCGIDIFASIFFMLTRWEEYAKKNRDKHERFPAAASLAHKFNFLHRPVVNEYLEMLKNMLFELDFNQKLKTRNYKLTLTHDVDHILAWDTPKKFLMRLGGDIIKKRANFADIVKTVFDYFKVLGKRAKDPFDTFDYIMDLSDKIGVKSHFFFMGRGQTKYDNDYFSGSKKAKAVAKKIKERGHLIGIHPTYNAYNDFEQFKREKEELEKNFETEIKFGREHYLRFEIPKTWQIWEDNGMEWDSTLSYAEEDGFRCGVCYEFRVFNFLTRKHLKLKEKPLVFMDATGIEKFSPKQMQEALFKLIGQVERYNGEAVILWHNSNYNTIKWRNYKKVYEALIEYHSVKKLRA